MSRLAYFATGWPIALATKGTVLEARGLASMMYTYMDKQKSFLAVRSLYLFM